MDRIKVTEFKSKIEKATGKKLHKTTYFRYRAIGLAPKNTQRKHYLLIDADKWIENIVNYEKKGLKERMLVNREARDSTKCAFTLMNQCLTNRG